MKIEMKSNFNMESLKIIVIFSADFLDNCFTTTNAHGEKEEECTKIFAQGNSDGKKGKLFQNDTCRLNRQVLG